eukprot:1177843-Prorocentrum_minimum.AAC.5
MGPTKLVVTHSEAPHVRPETIKIVGDSAGISKLTDEVASALAPDVEYRMREIIQVRLLFYPFAAPVFRSLLREP